MLTRLGLCVVLYLLTLSNCDDAGICGMPNGQTGSCVHISQCKPLADIYRKRQMSRLESLFIKKSTCSNTGYKMKLNSFGSDFLFTVPDLGGHQSMNMHVPYTGIRMRFQTKICCPPVYMWDNFLPSSTRSPPPPPPALSKNTYEHTNQDGLTICGLDSTTSNKIIGGKATNPNQYPWLALLQYSDGQLKCGGSLITSRFILTAAHCAFGLKGPPVLARLGEYNISSHPTDTIISAGGITEQITVTEIPVEDTYTYPLYGIRDRIHDIGLVKLSRNVEFSDMIQVICVPRTDFLSQFTTDTRFIVAGWGEDQEGRDFSDVKKDVFVPFVPMERCKSIYNNVNSKVVLLDEYQICAGGEEGKDTCKGDSGSPLMYQNDKSYIAVGVTSFGPENCGISGQPAVYTNVFKYLGWIKKKIADSMST